MRRINWLPVIGFVALAAGGCSHWAQQPGDEPRHQAQKPGAGERPATSSSSSATAPRGELTSDLVYEVLAGEISGQRGDFQAALEHYTSAARLSHDPAAAERATRIAVYLKDTDTALEAAELWVSVAPDNLDALHTAAVLYLANGQLDEALEHLRRVIAIEVASTEDVASFSQVANLLSKNQDPDRVLEVMQRLADEYPTEADARYALAMAALKAKDDTLAESSIRAALDLKPDNTAYRVFLGRVLLFRGEPEAAGKVLAEAIEDQPDSLLLRSAYARLLVELQDLEGARQQFVELLKTRPDNPEVLYAVGIMSLQLNETSDARIYFEKLVELDEKVDESAYYLGQIEEADGHNDKAISWYRRVTDAQLELDARIRVARLLGKQGKLTGARTEMQQLRNELPESAIDLYLIEADILAEAGQPGAAMRLYGEALEEHPGESDLLYARALQAVELGQLDAMERDLLQIIETDPNNADALNALGYTLADQTDRYQEALGYIERAFALKPDNAAILDSMGWVQYRLGNYPEALQYLQRALEMMPDSEIAAHFGEVLWITGQRGKARQVWEKALQSDPDSEELKDVMRRFQ
jgi:tetratricopeptide (TPR) repeat protein